MLIERKLLASRVEELNLSLKYKIVYLEGSPESRECCVTCPENSLFLKDLDYQNIKNNSLLLRLSFEGLIDPVSFKGLDYVCIQPDICQFISPDDFDVPLPYFSIIKLSSWINMDHAERGNCNNCPGSKNFGDKPYCPITTPIDNSGITFGVYFSLTEKEYQEFRTFQKLDKPQIPIVGMSLISNSDAS